MQSQTSAAASSPPMAVRVAREVFAVEIGALERTAAGLGDDFVRAVELLKGLRGKIICCGVGKSGLVAGKVAATFSSTGAPAFFMHAADAGHGDLGMIGGGDAVLLISHSGESGELAELVPAIKRLRAPIVAIVGDGGSSLAAAADIALVTAVDREACPHNLAPTASTTAALAMGDALAMALLTARGFSAADFAKRHPLGKLGRQLLLRVADVMHSGAAAPVVLPSAGFSRVLLEMTEKRLGMTLVGDAAGALLGIFTDGDLRRAFEKFGGGGDLRGLTAAELMTESPRTIGADALAVDALAQMRGANINQLAVVEGERIVGAVTLHDLMKMRIL